MMSAEEVDNIGKKGPQIHGNRTIECLIFPYIDDDDRRINQTSTRPPSLKAIWSKNNKRLFPRFFATSVIGNEGRL